MKKIETMKAIALIALMLVTVSSCDSDDGGSTEPEVSVEILTITPDGGGVGDEVTITGKNFSLKTDENKVLFGEVEAEVNFAYADRLLLNVPAKAGNVVTVWVNEKKASGSLDFAYNKALYLSTLSGCVDGGFDAGPSTLETAKFHNPYNLCVAESGVIYIAERCSHTIKKITTDGTVSVFAGRFIDNDDWGSKTHYKDGDLLTAEFNSPADIVYVGNNTFYVADFMNNAVRMIKDGQVTTFGGRRLGDNDWTNVEIFADDRKMPLSQFKFSRPSGLLYDKTGNYLYVSTHSHYIVRINLSDSEKIVEHVGGKMFNAGAAEGAIGTGQLNTPKGMTLDSKGNLYVANEYAHLITKIDNQFNHTIVAGWPDTPGAVDGDATVSRLNKPAFLVCDEDDNVLITDNFNHCIRKYDTKTGLLSLWAGVFDYEDVVDGGLSVAKMSFPFGIYRDATSGKIYITQTEGKSGVRVFDLE